MRKTSEITLFNESLQLHKDCNLCQESLLKIGQKTNYGSVIIYRIGTAEDGWFATLSPRTGGDPEKDFTIQLMSLAHLTHFSQMNSHEGLAKNFGTAFAKISLAMTRVMAEKDFKAIAEKKETSLSLATYGKSTNWKEKKEHLHLKIFPFRGDLGQPFTVDSSFGKKEIFNNPETGEEFVKMNPVRKNKILPERFKQLADLLISLLK